MKRAEVVCLDVVRAKQDEPSVRIEIVAWPLSGQRWYTEPSTGSRIGALRRGTWLLLADACEEYARSLREYVGASTHRKRGKRHRVRPRG